MGDRGPYANMRSGRFSVPKFTALPSDLHEMKAMSKVEKDKYIEKKLLEHKRALQREFDVVQHQALLQNVIEKCFDHCFQKPGPKMSNGQKKCLEECSDNLLVYQTGVMQMFVKMSKSPTNIPGPLSFIPKFD
ncbi:hypothetical protein AAMO2058_001041100 [Amorphochlora amoebiformis]|uniref:Mitochondrial import inner membrane translocase subunit n=1 Tax=Amorphochlora amoebiformis TaxID=1561963 RepID=A0A7S0H3C6_9EUKA|mmetsp:Transcript_26217/g.41467  ORF Transcript_26217/g.41467 Transcript_26217/m.41467 type:complete len:133 (+) Transcript_26217:107-505(+)|eukprot:350637-Amorphochlora_amoeboformis.AAC.1